MSNWKVGFNVLALSLILLGLGSNASDDDAASDRPAAKQQIMYFQPNGGFIPPRQIPFPFYPPPPPRTPPRRIPRPTQRPTRRSFDITTFLYYYLFFVAFSQTTPATTTTTTVAATAAPVTVCIGTWSDWGTCSANCAGTQSRRHSCTGAMEYRPCNQPGFTVDGWYRASNCYEYSVSTNAISHDDATAACVALGAVIAHIGLKNATVAAEIMAELSKFSSSPELVHIGLEYVAANTAWTWEDGDTVSAATSQIWAPAHPPTTPPTTLLCAVMELGNPRSAEDGNCTSARNYICERRVT